MKREFIHVRQYASRIEERKTGAKMVNGRRENERGRVHSRRHNRPYFPPSTIQRPRAAPHYLSIFSHFSLFSPTSRSFSLCCLFSRPCSTRHLTASSPLSNHSSRKTHSRNDGVLSLSQLSVQHNFPAPFPYRS